MGGYKLLTIRPRDDQPPRDSVGTMQLRWSGLSTRRSELFVVFELLAITPTSELLPQRTQRAHRLELHRIIRLPDFSVLPSPCCHFSRPLSLSPLLSLSPPLLQAHPVLCAKLRVQRVAPSGFTFSRFAASTIFSPLSLSLFLRIRSFNTETTERTEHQAPDNHPTG